VEFSQSNATNEFKLFGAPQTTKTATQSCLLERLIKNKNNTINPSFEKEHFIVLLIQKQILLLIMIFHQAVAVAYKRPYKKNSRRSSVSSTLDRLSPKKSLDRLSILCAASMQATPLGNSAQKKTAHVLLPRRVVLAPVMVVNVAVPASRNVVKSKPTKTVVLKTLHPTLDLTTTATTLTTTTTLDPTTTLDTTTDTSSCSNIRKRAYKSWSERFAELSFFKKLHGHCRVPQAYPENPALARWVVYQRAQYKAGSLDASKIMHLENAGFLWRAVVTDKWADAYAQVVLGNTSSELQEWVDHQRAGYKYLSKTRQDKLRALFPTTSLESESITRMETAKVACPLNASAQDKENYSARV
jgi:hypothetical protein